ncbi:MAG: molybdopterin biosynthesis protein [Coriobacteriia bacterium]|nr:molybdopterin biosynthesis protein [Coriobacteriia bacterium]
MAFQYLTNVALAKAKHDYMDILVQNGMEPTSEEMLVAQATGRMTAAPVYARINAPHYNACAMDGIALDARLTFGASETTPVCLKTDQYTSVDTGDLLPPGCDAVVMIEDVIKEGDEVRLFGAAAPWQHVRQVGEDVCAGEMLLPSYSLITPASIGAMIASGVAKVKVVKRPLVGIIPTGDELVLPTETPAPGDILEFNSSIFSAMLHTWGAETIVYGIVKDDLELIKAAIKTALAECDAVIVNAGSSAGSEDYATEAIADIGVVMYHGLAIKPGKPAILGFSESKPILGVPGYPVSGIIVVEEVLRPIVDLLCGRVLTTYDYVDAILSKAIVSTLKYQEFVRVRMGYVKGRLIASPLNRGGGVVTSFMHADGIVEVPQDVEGYESGEKVHVRLLRPTSELERSLVAIGSHDPLFDELSELMRVTYGDISLSSSHVGSMGGILALRNSEAHVAGIHLLDEETGEYNASFVKRFFPKGGVRLVECVKRIQGLIVQNGNPLGIHGIDELTIEGLRYVNRQKGSGTRILIDFLCRAHGIDTSLIYGYSREECTHTLVATQIAAGSADVGLGVYAAAKMYDLDFLPIGEEQYDLLIPDYAWDMPITQRFLETLRSDAFRARLEALGGYVIGNPGSVREL